MTLQLPRLLYGRYRDVRPRLMRIVKHMVKGNDWLSMVESDGFLDVASTSGSIVGDGPSSLLGRDEHFQMWFLWEQAWRKADGDGAENTSKIFADSLTRPWSLLGLMMPGCQLWLWNKERHRPFLAAVAPHWDDFSAVGARYTTGSRNPNPLWRMPSGVPYAMGNQDIPTDLLRSPLEPGTLARYLSEYGIEPVNNSAEATPS